MPSIFTSLDIDAAVESMRFSAPTADVTDHDPDVADFVERAVTQQLPPTVFEVQAGFFPRSVPQVLHTTAAWVHWLGEGFDDEIDELTHAQPLAGDYFSTDLLQRRAVLRWNTSGHAFCTSARTLQGSLRSAIGGEVLAFFVSPTRFVAAPVWLGFDLLDDLNEIARHTGSQYRPDEHFTRQMLSSAWVRSVLHSNKPTTDEQGRKVVLLNKGVFVQS